MKRSRLLLAALAILIIGPGFAWIMAILRDVNRTTTEATQSVAREGVYPTRVIALDRPLPAGFEVIQAPAQYSDAAFFHNELYLCGPGGLTARSTTIQARFPPAPSVAMAASPQQLWIATRGEGLLSFDGKALQQIRPDSPAARILTAVLPLETGRILVGTETLGVLSWDGKALTQLHPNLANLPISALAGTDTDLWVGTVDKGLLHWHAGQLDRFTEADGIPDARILSLVVTATGAYAGTALGVAEFRDGKLDRKLASGVFARSLLVRSETLEVGTLEEGVIEVPLDVRQQRPRPPPVLHVMPAITRLLESDGHLYALATDGLYENGRRIFEAPHARLADRNISALSLDFGGNLWVGYFDRGLDRLNPSFENRTHYEDDHLFCVNRIVQQNDRGVTAVGTANGLVLFDAGGKVRQVLTKKDGLIANTVTDVLLRPEGGMVAITAATPAGITTMDAAGVTSLYAFHGLVNNHVYSLAALDTKLLAGTLGGLSVLNSGVVRASYTTANSGLKQNWITALQRLETVWLVGTYGSGVMQLDDAGRITAFPDFKGRVEINVNAMTVTPIAAYAGTLDNGLAVYSRSSGRWSFVTNGLPSPNVTALASGSGYVYIGTDNGLVRIAERQVPMQ